MFCSKLFFYQDFENHNPNPDPHFRVRVRVRVRVRESVFLPEYK